MTGRSGSRSGRVAEGRSGPLGSSGAPGPGSPVSGSLVLIVSADGSLRRWWSQGLGDGFVLEEIENVGAAKSALINRKPSVVLLDLALPGLGGLKGLAAFARLSPMTRIVVLGDDREQSEAVASLKAGAHGYCAREIDSTLIRKAVETVQKGELWVRRRVMLALLRELIPVSPPAGGGESRDDARLRPLTSREREIAYLVAAGARNKDVAASLSITETTVKAHLTAIFRKLGIPDRLRLALMLSKQERGSPKPRSGRDAKR